MSVCIILRVKKNECLSRRVYKIIIIISLLVTIRGPMSKPMPMPAAAGSKSQEIRCQCRFRFRKCHKTVLEAAITAPNPEVRCRWNWNNFPVSKTFFQASKIIFSLLIFFPGSQDYFSGIRNYFQVLSVFSDS